GWELRVPRLRSLPGLSWVRWRGLRVWCIALHVWQLSLRRDRVRPGFISVRGLWHDERQHRLGQLRVYERADRPVGGREQRQRGYGGLHELHAVLAPTLRCTVTGTAPHGLGPGPEAVVGPHPRCQ